MLAALWRVPMVLLVQDLPIEAALGTGMVHGGFLLRRARDVERAVYRLAHRIVVIGDQFRDNLVAKGVRDELITVIPNWVDLDTIRPRPPDPEVRRYLSGADVEFLVLHAGTMAEKQGLQTVVEAAQMLKGEAHIRTVLVGDGPNRAKLEAAIGHRQLHNIRVMDIQPVDFLPRMLTSSDVLLLNQRAGVIDSVVPSKLISYMAAGRPVIAAANDKSVAAKLVTEAGCGVVVPPEDPVRLADAIRWLRARPDVCQAFGRRGREYAEGRYGRDTILRRWDQLIAEETSGIKPASSLTGLSR
jgi:colanic acid biosynthesis glycosyl transferase WcaI